MCNFSFIIFYVLSNLLLVIFNLSDTIILNLTNNEHLLLSISQINQIYSLVTMMALGFNSAILTIASSYLTKHKPYDKLFNTAIIINSFFSLLFTIIILIFAPNLINLLQLSKHIHNHNEIVFFIRLSSPQIIFIIIYNLFHALNRSKKDAFKPFLTILFGTLFKLIVTILFINKLTLSTLCIITLLAQAIIFITSIHYFHKSFNDYHFKFSYHKATGIEIFKLGLPFALLGCVINIYSIATNALVNNFNQISSTAYMLTLRLDEIVNRLSQSITLGQGALITKALSKKQFDLVKKHLRTSFLLNLALYALTFIIYYFYKDYFLLYFVKDQNVITLCSSYLTLSLLAYPANILFRGSNAYIRGEGNGKLTLIIAIVDTFVLKIGLGYILSLYYETTGYLLAFIISSYFSMLVALKYVLKKLALASYKSPCS